MQGSPSVARIAAAFAVGSLCIAAHADTERFTIHKAMDTEGTPHSAVSYLVPKGWKSTDVIRWDVTRNTVPLSLNFVTTSPDGRFVIRWSNMAAFKFSHLGNQGMKGTDAPEHPSDLLIQAFKKGHPGIDPETVEQKDTPTESQFRQSASSTSRAFASSVKLRWQQDGVSMLTKSGFSYDSYEVGTNPQFSTGQWSLHNITSVTGPEAEWPKAMKLAAVVLSSRQWDPQFFQQYAEVVNMLLKQIRQEGEARLQANFEALRQHFHDLSELNRSAFNAQMAAKDKSTRNFCDYVLDRERFSDGRTEFILPSGYKRAATNGTDYVVTDNPDFKPIGDWHELKKVN